MKLIVLMGTLILLYVNLVHGRKRVQESKPIQLESKRYQALHHLSFYQPFDYFLRGAEETEKTRKLKKNLSELNLGERFTLRSFLTFQYLLFFLVMAVVVGLYMVPVRMGMISPRAFLLLSAFLMVASLFPKQIIKDKAKKCRYFYNNEVIVLQLFIILLLKSSSNIEDVLFSLSNMKSFYQGVFEKAYRMSFRSKESALAYLEDFFKESKFGDTFGVLARFSEYSRKNSVSILEANLRVLEQESLNSRRKDELMKFSYAQMSIVIPLMVAVFWGALPVIFYGINVMTAQILTM